MNVLLVKNNGYPERSRFGNARQLASFNSRPSQLDNVLREHAKAFESNRCDIKIMPIRQSALRGADNFLHAQVGYKLHRQANSCASFAASSLTQGSGNQTGKGRLFCWLFGKTACADL
jgi:hypothetical protein